MTPCTMATVATVAPCTTLVPSCLSQVATIVRMHCPIRTVRVSCAQAKGRAKKYSYWGAVRYQVRFAADGHLTCAAQERASSARRSIAGAERDAERLAERDGRVESQALGRVTESRAYHILRQPNCPDYPYALCTGSAA